MARGVRPDTRFRSVPDDVYNYSRFRRSHVFEELRGVLSRRGLGPGAPAPNFELPRVGGGRLRLSALRDRPVLLHFASYT